MAKVRNLKIGESIRQSKAKTIGNRKLSIVPQLRIEGNWFRDAGFAPGQSVRVEIFEGAIVLKPVKMMEVVR